LPHGDCSAIDAADVALDAAALNSARVIPESFQRVSFIAVRLILPERTLREFAPPDRRMLPWHFDC